MSLLLCTPGLYVMGQICADSVLCIIKDRRHQRRGMRQKVATALQLCLATHKLTRTGQRSLLPP